MSDKLKVRVISPWFHELETPDALFSVNIQAGKADALLCEWSPHDDLFTFPRRKAWYCCEPSCQFRTLGMGNWPAIRARMAPGEFFCHGNSDFRWRVPHVTHFEALDIDRRIDREIRAVAVVSNHGGNPWRRHTDINYRNRFATHPKVDLYGRKSWMKYRTGWLNRAAAPNNYKGELPGDWHASEKRELMSRYRVAVCLENSAEPYYFTEKFVEAVCAGCVPIYHAHPTIAQTILRGATWIDPADYGNDPDATLDAAFSTDAESMRQKNNQWLASPELLATHHRNIFALIGQILARPVSNGIEFAGH